MVGLVVGVIAAFLLFKSGILSSLNLGTTGLPPTGYVPPPPTLNIGSSINAAQFQQEGQLASSVIGTTTSALSSLTASGGALSNLASSGVANSIPIIGAAFSAIASTLIAASQKRAQEAKTENSAVAQAIPGWDNAVAQIVAAYNAGSLTYVQVDSLLSTIMSNYWNETSPQIQPGRNGCGSGANCPPSIAPNSGSATNSGGANYCSGNIGAACCVGCADLQLSVDNMEWAVAQATKTGQPSTAFIQQVFASKYGGANRAAYLVTFIPPAISAIG